MADEQEEIRKQLQRIEVALTKVQERVALLYWVCVIVLVIYGLSTLVGVLGLLSVATPGSAQLTFPALIVGAAVLVFLFKRRPEP